MNFSICGVDNDNNESERANIIFSTFVNFECFYLHLMDNCPGYIEKYFNGCGLLVDEVDSILIDEITTGTIVSREIESNAKEILSYVYKNRKNKSAADIYKYIKETFDFNEDDFSEIDVEQMFKEIDLVNNKKFQDGKKYIIETFTVKNNQRIKNFIKKTVQNVMDISNIAKDKIKSLLKNAFSNDESENQNDDDDDESDDDNNDNLDTSKFKQFKRIIPFDYDHKGIPEPNKEFSGFIQQFISLKENRNDLIFKNISINYLYISHPIFSKLYKHIFGLTGTVGDKNDKTILFQQYNLITKNVPRHKPNLRVDLPMIVCSGISERNEKIVNDVLKFHEKGNPVLVIFLDFNEIDDVERIIYSMKNDENFNESVCNLLGGSFSIPSIFGLDFGQFLNGPLLLKISINLILLLACFLIIFIKHKRRVEYSKSDSKEFDSSYNNKNEKETSDKLASISERKEKNIKMKVHLKDDIDSSKSKEFNTLVDNFINSENFEYIPSYMKISDKKTVDKKSRFKKAKKSDEYRFEKIEHDEYKLNLADIINLNFDTNECYHNPSKNHCLKVYFNISKELFDHISFFSSCKHPIFAPFIGYVLSCDKSFLLFKSIPKSERNINSNYLSNSGNKKFSSLEDGLIFAYRIANAFEYLENHKIFIQNFNPNYVLLIDNLPFIYGLNLGKDKENINYIAPEFSKDSNCFSNKSNVFSLGIMLYVMFASFLCDINQFSIKESDFATILGDKSIFNPSFGENWCDLVFQCLDADQNKRITFSEICDNIEKNYKYLNSEILKNTIDKLKTFRPTI